MKRAQMLLTPAVAAAAGCMLLVIVLTNSHAASRVVVHAAPLETPTTTPTVTATATPSCTHGTAMTIALSDPAPQLGQRITATVSLTNTGNCTVGLPLYTLNVANIHPVAVFEESENPALHNTAIYSHAVDSVDFRLLVANTGVFTLTSHASFEVHVGYPGPAFWGGASATPITFTVPSTDTGMVIMTQAAYHTGCLGDDAFIQSTLALAPTYFGCAIAAGHGIGATLADYGNATAARAAFFVQAEGHNVVPFAGCRPSFVVEESGGGPMVLRRETWVGDHWLVVGYSQDDTALTGGITGAGSVHKALLANELLQPCRSSYLPSIKTK